MKGADYVAVKRLTTKDEQVLAMPGERCDLVPAKSLPWLLADGLIAKPDPDGPAPKPPKRPKGKAAKGGE